MATVSEPDTQALPGEDLAAKNEASPENEASPSKEAAGPQNEASPDSTASEEEAPLVEPYVYVSVIRTTRSWIQYGVCGFVVLCIVIGAVEALFGR